MSTAIKIMKFTHQQFLKYLTIRKMELEINKHMQDFGQDKIVTLSPITRLLMAKWPEILKNIDELLNNIGGDNK